MAFKTVSPPKKRFIKATGTPVKATAMEVGEEIVGYVVGFNPSLQNPDNMNILIKPENGPVYYLYTAGNLKYLIKDEKITLGLLTKITRTENKIVKGGKSSSQFSVEQDDEQTIDIEQVIDESMALGAAAQGDGFDKIPSASSLDAKKAAERSSVKARAAQMTSNLKKA